MNTVRRLHPIAFNLALLISFVVLAPAVLAQAPVSMNGANASRSSGKPVTIPLTIKINSRELQSENELQNIDLTVSEDGEPQTILSLRGVGTNSPITLAVLIQEDLVSVGNEIKSLAEFIRNLPKGSRVMIGYLRTGSLQTKQKFTADLEKAAKALRPPSGFANSGPYNPYVEVIEALRKFDSQPLGRRARWRVDAGDSAARADPRRSGADGSARGTHDPRRPERARPS